VPHWTAKLSTTRAHLDATLDGIQQQTDDDWQIILVDDASPCRDVYAYFEELRGRLGSRLQVLINRENRGPGVSRNRAIEAARRAGSPFILFNDADDLSHPRRLEVVRRVFAAEPVVDVVYSTFHVIDEYGHPLPFERLTGSIQEILEGHRSEPLQGSHVWVSLGTERGYTTLTSSTAVRTELAHRYEFPPAYVSEDAHAWLLYSAGGGEFRYCPEIPSAYRIPQRAASSSRARVAGFYEKKAETDERAFHEAIAVAGRRDSRFADSARVSELRIKFYLRLATTLGREHCTELAAQQVEKALRISGEKTLEHMARSSTLVQTMITTRATRASSRGASS
jgi:glycosyltransferase involved in cell wall biosynthesis